MILLIHWMGGTDRDETYLGGFNFNELIFNYHPVFMTCGMLVCGTCSMMSYRVIPLPKLIVKKFHAFMHTAAIVLIILGLACVITGNNYKSKNEYHTYYANLASIHSMMGLSTCIIYALNYFLGLFAFLMPGFSVEARKAFMPNHVFIGVFALIAASCSALTGIIELTAEYGCGYEVTSADWNAAQHYHRLTDGCKEANGAGYCIFVSLLLATYALIGPSGVAKEGMKEPLFKAQA